MQDEVAQRTGLVQRYISRAENDHAVPKLETLEKWARSMQVSWYVFSMRKTPIVTQAGYLQSWGSVLDRLLQHVVEKPFDDVVGSSPKPV